MRFALRPVLLAGLFLLPTASFADQCAWVTPAIAKKAVKALEATSEIVVFCELCTGDKPRAIKVSKVEQRVADKEYQEIFVNGEGIDLAYTFVPVKGEEHRYQNLSKVVACESSGVSRFIKYPLEKADEAKDWSGHYGDENKVVWTLSKPSAGPSYSIQVELISADENGGGRGSFSDIADLENGRLQMAMPFPGCSFDLTKAGKTLIVGAKGSCGPLGSYLVGNFPAAKDQP